MNDTITALRRWWHGRAPREHVMLATMAALLAAFAWWYGLLWPLRALREDAQARHGRAVAGLQAAEAAAAAPGASGATASQQPAGEALQRLVLDSARVAGIDPTRQRTAADGSFVLEFERVESPALFGWLGDLVDTRGIAPASLRVERADGQLRAEAGFAGAAP